MNINLSDEAWLNQQYKLLLNRPLGTDTGGRDYWLGHLDAGTQTKQQIIDNIMLSNEYFDTGADEVPEGIVP